MDILRSMFQLIFILLSIKTRIETFLRSESNVRKGIFLSYYPLKQGLKRKCFCCFPVVRFKFLSYYPLKQGLKLLSNNPNPITVLKIFILLSIKTRIET